MIEIDVDELAQRLSEGARLIDVREPDEYESGHVPGAISIPLGTIPDHLDQLDPDGPTYMICGSGGRSRRAAEFAESQTGLTDRQRRRRHEGVDRVRPRDGGRRHAPVTAFPGHAGRCWTFARWRSLTRIGEMVPL